MSSDERAVIDADPQCPACAAAAQAELDSGPPRHGTRHGHVMLFGLVAAAVPTLGAVLTAAVVAGPGAWVRGRRRSPQVPEVRAVVDP